MEWTEEFIGEQVEGIRAFVGDQKALVALSGGVDSSVVAMLAYNALPSEQVAFVTIDDGFRRKGEPEWVAITFKELGITAEIVVAENVIYRSYLSLRQARSAGEKRKWFRQVFYELLAFEAQKLGATIALQGTNKADVQETVAGVKAQHNVLSQIGIDPLVEYGIKVYEPLAELYKDQIRKVARILKLPKEICTRMPFPGPGLSIRVYGAPTKPKIAIIREITAIVEKMLLPLNPFQVLAYLGPKATGVSTEGKRINGYVVYVRAVNSIDAITATPIQMTGQIEDELIAHITAAFPSEISHVLFDYTPKPPATIEFE